MDQGRSKDIKVSKKREKSKAINNKCQTRAFPLLFNTMNKDLINFPKTQVSPGCFFEHSKME